MTQASNSGNPKDVQPPLSEMGSWILPCSPRLKLLLFSRTSVHTSTFSSVEHQCVCQLCRCGKILKIIRFLKRKLCFGCRFGRSRLIVWFCEAVHHRGCAAKQSSLPVVRVQGSKGGAKSPHSLQGHTPNVLTLPDSAHLQKLLLTPN